MNLKNLYHKAKQYKGLSGVYFLYYENNLIYIGQTTNMLKRIWRLRHKPINRKGKCIFDSFKFIPIFPSKLLRTEKAYIRIFKPSLNIQWNNKKPLKTNTAKKNRIDILLKEKGLTKLRTSFKIGVSRPGLIYWCQNRTQPKKKYIPAICRALNCKEWDLFV